MPGQKHVRILPLAEMIFLGDSPILKCECYWPRDAKTACTVYEKKLASITMLVEYLPKYLAVMWNILRKRFRISLPTYLLPLSCIPGENIIATVIIITIRPTISPAHATHLL